jgi:hypothetical protein
MVYNITTLKSPSRVLGLSECPSESERSPLGECKVLQWKPCLGSVVAVHMFHAMPIRESQTTFNGGSPPSRGLTSIVPSQNQSSSSILLPIRTPVQALGSLSQSENGGVRGNWSQAGGQREARGTSHGLKTLVLSSLYTQSPGMRTLNSITGYMATTRELWKGGGMEEAVTAQPTMFSSVYTNTSTESKPKPLSTPSTSPVLTTQPTYPHEAYMHPPTSSSHTSNLLHASGCSSWIPQSRTLPPNSDYTMKASTPKQPQSTLTMLSNVLVLGSTSALSRVMRPPVYGKPHGLVNDVPCFSPPLPPAFSLTRQPRPYQPGLALAPSPLRPHCLAVDRLRCWLPAVTWDAVNARGERVNITDQDLERTLVVHWYYGHWEPDRPTGQACWCSTYSVTPERYLKSNNAQRVQY